MEAPFRITPNPVGQHQYEFEQRYTRLFLKQEAFRDLIFGVAGVY